MNKFTRQARCELGGCLQVLFVYQQFLLYAANVLEESTVISDR